jgi:ABC-type lipoprotein release transport system permease subunit
VLAFNVSTQVSDGITENAMWYSVIVGPSGSETQLAMNTMYFTDKPVGTIPFSVVSSLSSDARVTLAVPFSMADNYNGASVIGTTTDYLKKDGALLKLKDGEMFDDFGSMQVVVGANVASRNGLKIGDEIRTSHSASSIEAHETPLTVVGILEKTNSTFDNVVFTQYRTLWEVHDHGETDEHTSSHVDGGHGEENGDGGNTEGDNIENGEHTGDHTGSGNEEHAHEKTVCAVLLKTKNPAVAMQIISEYNGKVILDEDGNAHTLQAITPMGAVREVLDDADDTKYIVFVLCAVILVMNIMIISIITLLNMYHSAKEISLMRLIGVSMKKINLLYLIQNGIIGLFSVFVAFLTSRILLVLMNDYVSSMGVVLNLTRVYFPEIIILVSVFLISIIPTLIWTLAMSKKDSMAG